MPSSLTFKLTLAFLVVSLIGVALVAIFSRLITEREFDRFRLEQARSDFITAATAYYQAHDSWQGIDAAIGPGPFQPQPGGGGPPPMPQPPFALVDMNNIVVLSGGPHRLGERLPPEELEQGTPLLIEGQQRGTILSDAGPPRNPLEEQYLARTNQAVLIATAGAAVVALAVGILLARTLTRSLRELTAAALAMAAGNLAQSVPVRSQDELGQLTQAFNQMSAAVTRANQLRRQITADIAHDLRTPLSVISGYLEAMREGELVPTPPRIEAIYAESQQLNRLVTDLRTLSLADAGELSLNRQPVAVDELLNRVASAYAHQAEQQHISLVIQTEDNLPAINGDPDRLIQVLSNLVSNALRYTPEKGQITLAVSHLQAGKVQLRVEDTGLGIAAADLPYIFHRFYRTDKSRQQAEGESGLGLAIVKAIVEAHGGTITVESEPGRGTIFTILLTAV